MLGGLLSFLLLFSSILSTRLSSAFSLSNFVSTRFFLLSSGKLSTFFFEFIFLFVSSERSPRSLLLVRFLLLLFLDLGMFGWEVLMWLGLAGLTLFREPERCSLLWFRMRALRSYDGSLPL